MNEAEQEHKHTGGSGCQGREISQIPADMLLPLVYDELRRLAAAKMAREAPGQTLQATALVHEAWIRLGGEEQSWDDQSHFFGAAAEAMRRILIDRARTKQAAKRGGGWQRLDLDFIDQPSEAPDEALLRVSEAVEVLELEDPKAAEFVKLRFFAGLKVEEAALAMGISDRTGRRYWRFARAWLHDHLSEGDA